jgi:hypothetical protein
VIDVSKLVPLLVIAACEPDPIEVQLDDIEVESFAQLKLALSTVAEHGAELWREPITDHRFTLDAVPILWMRSLDDGSVDADGYLIQHPSPRGPEALNPVFDSIAPVYLQQASEALLAGRAYNLAVSISGAETFVFAWTNQLESPLDPRTPGFAALLVHESFHRYQLYEGGWTPYESFVEDPERYPVVTNNVALALLENEILATALRTTALFNLEGALRQFVAVRRARRSLPEVVVDGINFVRQSDHALELYEGSARIVEDGFRELATTQTPELSVSGLLAELEGAVQSADAFTNAAVVRAYFSRGRQYQTGSALGRLLDRLNRDWRSAAAHGKAPIDVLDERYSYLNNDDLERLLAQAKQAHDFDGVIAERTAFYMSRPDVP